MIARDIMQTDFHTLNPRDTIAEAVPSFQVASESEGKKVFGLMVTDDNERLVGMLSMYDILIFIQPKHGHIWREIEDVDPTGLFDESLERVKSILVGDIMTTEVVTINPDTHILAIADIMIKKHIRRLPVIDDKEVVGIVYVSDVFYYLLDKPVSKTPSGMCTTKSKNFASGNRYPVSGICPPSRFLYPIQHRIPQSLNPQFPLTLSAVCINFESERFCASLSTYCATGRALVR
jgi:CBS domain-containing protein